jgi:hypothetical protein
VVRVAIERVGTSTAIAVDESGLARGRGGE